MEFKVTMKSGERGEGEVTLSVIAGNEADALQWGEHQMKSWEWAQGTVVKVEQVSPVDVKPA